MPYGSQTPVLTVRALFVCCALLADRAVGSFESSLHIARHARID